MLARIILASASPRRLDLLENLGLKPLVLPAQIDEDQVVGETPEETAQACALTKARFIYQQGQKGLIIGADTVVVLEGEVLGKPRDEREAVAMLTKLSGRVHRVITGLALIDGSTGASLADHVITEVTFRSLSPEEIRAYVATGEPLDKAGAYGIQGRGAVLVAGIHGCYFNVVGLPLARLYEMLGHFGCNLLDDPSHAQGPGGSINVSKEFDGQG
ncbi:MAG: Maf family protein [Limnochordia bacterium]